MATFKMNPLEKKEEQTGKDLDGDGEQGEPVAHQKKVLHAGKTLSPNQKVPSMKDKMSKMGGATPKLPTGAGKPMASQTDAPPSKANPFKKASGSGAKKSPSSSGSSTAKRKQVPMIPSKMCPLCIKGKAKSCSHQ